MQPGPRSHRGVHLLVIRRCSIGKSGETLQAGDVQIVEGLGEQHVEQALRVTHQGFAEKFRIGFRNAEDFVRLFKDSVDRDSCLTAIVDGRASGILASKTKERKFYELKNSTLFATFWPLRTALVLFNLVLLTQILGDSVEHDEFEVDTIAVDPTLRGLGIGTALMLKAEEQAKSQGMLKTSLYVISKNTGAQ